MTDWKSELGFEIVKHEPELGMPIYLVREDGADDREATITERVLWGALVKKSAANGEPVAHVAEIHMSRYTLEWTNGPLPEGAPLYAAPQPASISPSSTLSHNDLLDLRR